MKEALGDGALTLPRTPANPGTSRGLVTRIRAAYSSLSAAERKFADAVLADPSLPISMGLTELAIRVGVSDATLVRCSQFLGYDGFRDLRMAAAAESGSSTWLAGGAVKDTDDIGTIAEKVLGSNIQAIADTLAVLDRNAVGLTVDMLLAAPRIELYGTGSSVPVALDAYYRLVRLGLPVSIVTDPHMQAISATHAPDGTMVMAISHTGRTYETIAAVRRAKQAGAKCILLTSYRHTPLGKLADVEIVTASPESAIRPEAVSCRVAHLAIVDVLSVAIAARRPNESRAALLKDDEIIEERQLN